MQSSFIFQSTETDWYLRTWGSTTYFESSSLMSRTAIPSPRTTISCHHSCITWLDAYCRSKPRTQLKLLNELMYQIKFYREIYFCALSHVQAYQNVQHEKIALIWVLGMEITFTTTSGRPEPEYTLRRVMPSVLSMVGGDRNLVGKGGASQKS